MVFIPKPTIEYVRLIRNYEVSTGTFTAGHVFQVISKGGDKYFKNMWDLRDKGGLMVFSVPSENLQQISREDFEKSD